MKMNKKLMSLCAVIVLVLTAVSATGAVTEEVRKAIGIEDKDFFSDHTTEQDNVHEIPPSAASVNDDIPQVSTQNNDVDSVQSGEKPDFDILFLTPEVQVHAGEVAQFILIVSDLRPSVVPSSDGSSVSHRFRQKYNTQQTYMVDGKKYDITLIADDWSCPMMKVNGEHTPCLLGASSFVMEDSTRIVFYTVLDKEGYMDFEIKPVPSEISQDPRVCGPRTVTLTVLGSPFAFELSAESVRMMPDSSVEVHLFIDTSTLIGNAVSLKGSPYTITVVAKSNGITKTAKALLLVEGQQHPVPPPDPVDDTDEQQESEVIPDDVPPTIVVNLTWDDAEALAKKLILGDVDGSGGISWCDVELLMNYLMGQVEFNRFQLKVADVDGSGEINIADTIMLVRQVVGNGDVDGSDQLTWRDVELLMQYQFGTGVEFNQFQIAVADVDGDGNITISDSILLIQKIKNNGDIDGNGYLSWVDMQMLLDYEFNGSELNQFQLACADYDGDGEITISDAIAIGQMIAHNGDVDGFGTVTWVDLDLQIKYILHTVQFNEYQLNVADVDHDGDVDFNDIAVLESMVWGNGDIDADDGISWTDLQLLVEDLEGLHPLVYLQPLAADVIH